MYYADAKSDRKISCNEIFPRERASPEQFLQTNKTGKQYAERRDTKNVQSGLLHWINLVKVAVSSLLSSAQRCKKHDLDKNVQQESKCKLGSYVIVYTLHIAGIASEAAKQIANSPYNMLLRRASGPHKVLSIKLQRVSIEG